MSPARRSSPPGTEALRALGSAGVRALVKGGADRLAQMLLSTPGVMEMLAQRVYGEEHPMMRWSDLAAVEKEQRIRIARWHIAGVRDLVEGP